MRTLLPRVLAVCCLVVVAAGPGVAAAQNDPFSTTPPLQSQTTPTVTSSSAATNQHSGLNQTQEILVFMVAVALIAGIGFAIVNDAHRAAPVSADELAGAHKTSPAGARKAQSKTKARQQAKRAKAARKRNR